ncbi:hypothetical protein FRX31_024370 [Thalictrum thalictroides]|uniref:Tetrapyrrole biosynthesis uroporphyrinogen III synthase domain-containing protein n=1 Tax=Thalictrum thalictroides TaxID=46969 RepID=A0A7J6VPC1_THATH|nr:hypothetical protein FRX31_024370 [Thalictrum thalictroides]
MTTTTTGNLAPPPPPLPPPLSPPPPRIAFTTPSNYAKRLSIQLKNHHQHPILLSCPTVIVESTFQTKQFIKPYLSILEDFSAIAFTSRTGITAFSETLLQEEEDEEDCHHYMPLKETGDVFTLSALGKDAELLNSDFISKLCVNDNRIRVLVPSIATPLSLVESLGLGFGRKVLCPVPVVIGLDEPSVVPDFLEALSLNDWIPVKVSAYETRWAGADCAAPLLERLRMEGEGVDAIVFTSTAEVQGLLKSLSELGFDWEMVRKRWPGLVVAAHGPVTAAGANSLGVSVDVVGSRFGSFEGVVEALMSKLGYQ